MEAKDTVMNNEQLLKAGAYFPYINYAPLQNAIEGQAEISFKLGREQERERLLHYLKGLLASTPRVSLATTIDLIELRD